MEKSKAAFMSIFFFAAFCCISCAPGIRLNTQGAPASDVTGSYTLILYGCNFFDDIETVAFLDREGDKFSFSPYAPRFRYRVEKGVDARDALSRAMGFVNCSTSFRAAQLSRIVTPDGGTAGYEVRPLYHSFTYGVSDVLDTSYRLKDGHIVITIRLLPGVEMMLRGDGFREREK